MVANGKVLLICNIRIDRQDCLHPVEGNKWTQQPLDTTTIATITNTSTSVLNPPRTETMDSVTVAPNSVTENSIQVEATKPNSEEIDNLPQKVSDEISAAEVTPIPQEGLETTIASTVPPSSKTSADELNTTHKIPTATTAPCTTACEMLLLDRAEKAEQRLLQMSKCIRLLTNQLHRQYLDCNNCTTITFGLSSSTNLPENFEIPSNTTSSTTATHKNTGIQRQLQQAYVPAERIPIQSVNATSLVYPANNLNSTLTLAPTSFPIHISSPQLESTVDNSMSNTRRGNDTTASPVRHGGSIDTYDGNVNEDIANGTNNSTSITRTYSTSSTELESDSIATRTAFGDSTANTTSGDGDFREYFDRISRTNQTVLPNIDDRAVSFPSLPLSPSDLYRNSNDDDNKEEQINTDDRENFMGETTALRARTHTGGSSSCWSNPSSWNNYPSSSGNHCVSVIVEDHERFLNALRDIQEDHEDNNRQFPNDDDLATANAILDSISITTRRTTDTTLRCDLLALQNAASMIQDHMHLVMQESYDTYRDVANAKQMVQHWQDRALLAEQQLQQLQEQHVKVCAKNKKLHEERKILVQAYKVLQTQKQKTLLHHIEDYVANAITVHEYQLKHQPTPMQHQKHQGQFKQPLCINDENLALKLGSSDFDERQSTTQNSYSYDEDEGDIVNKMDSDPVTDNDLGPCENDTPFRDASNNLKTNRTNTEDVGSGDKENKQCSTVGDEPLKPDNDKKTENHSESKQAQASALQPQQTCTPSFGTIGFGAGYYNPKLAERMKKKLGLSPASTNNNTSMNATQNPASPNGTVPVAAKVSQPVTVSSVPTETYSNEAKHVKPLDNAKTDDETLPCEQEEEKPIAHPKSNCHQEPVVRIAFRNSNSTMIQQRRSPTTIPNQDNNQNQHNNSLGARVLNFFNPPFGEIQASTTNDTPPPKGSKMGNTNKQPTQSRREPSLNNVAVPSPAPSALQPLITVADLSLTPTSDTNQSYQRQDEKSNDISNTDLSERKSDKNVSPKALAHSTSARDPNLLNLSPIAAAVADTLDRLPDGFRKIVNDSTSPTSVTETTDCGGDLQILRSLSIPTEP